MNLIVVIVRFLLGLFSEGCAEVQLVPVRTCRTSRTGRSVRPVRWFWIPGAGWYVLQPELRQRGLVFQWLAGKRFLAFFEKGGGRFHRTGAPPKRTCLDTTGAERGRVFRRVLTRIRII